MQACDTGDVVWRSMWERGGTHIHKRYEATNDWFGNNRGLLLLLLSLFIVLLAIQAYIHSHSFYP